MSDGPETSARVIKIAQELVLAESDHSAVSTDSIAKAVDTALRILPTCVVDRGAIMGELIRRFSVWIGKDAILMSESGHQRWLTSGRKREWRYWTRYREWLDLSLPNVAVERLDSSTDRILEQLEEPSRDGPWDRRGLVVGHVQSGKTANYTGLICKAADAGYKIIIVLAGMHNNLRAQTQMRLDEGFVGYETNPRRDAREIIGVGTIDSEIRTNYVTNRTERGDFNTAIAKHLGITPESRPWLFVVKKNKTVLDRLQHWIANHVADTTDSSSGRPIVTNLPLLLIDDEADHGSVDTGEQVFGEDGTPDEEHQPTAINRLVRRLLHTFTRAAYVGYTATPFANIFIHERGRTRDEGPDLFPSAFIVNLGAPSNYVGPARVFGLPSGDEQREGLPLLREIADHAIEAGSGWMPANHRNHHVPRHQGSDALPPSLCEAIDAFLLACCIRQHRGQGQQHASMLIHVTRYTSVQEQVHRQVAERVRQLKQRLTRHLDEQALLERLLALWQRDFAPTTTKVRVQMPDAVPLGEVNWESILAVLPDVVSDIEVRTVNGTAKDVLDYSEYRATGLKVIAIGGDKLARGLTLEHLCVSYFLRASRMYDTLMQMGRWFGYRPGYLDLCRLYTTAELIEWFRHITDAAEELREEFDLMAASGSTPREYGLKVQSHPVLMVTSRLKMRAARNLMVSFSGQLLETVVFVTEMEALAANVQAAERLVRHLGAATVDPWQTRVGERQQWEGTHLWSGVPAGDIIEFLQTYRVHPAAYKVNSLVLAGFIERMASKGELTSWMVVLIGAGDERGPRREYILGRGITARLLKRTSERDDRYSIGRLMSPRDESIDLEDDAWTAALDLTRQAWREDAERGRARGKEPRVPNGAAIRWVRGFGGPGIAPHPERGVFFLYLLDPQEAGRGLPQGAPPVVAFAVSFPGSNSGLKVEYKVNNVLWEQEYGGAE